MVLVAGRANKHFLAALEHGVRIGEHWLAINAVTCGALPPIEVLYLESILNRARFGAGF